MSSVGRSTLLSSARSAASSKRTASSHASMSSTVSSVPSMSSATSSAKSLSSAASSVPSMSSAASSVPSMSSTASSVASASSAGGCGCAPKPKKCACAQKKTSPCGCSSGSAGPSALEKKILKSKNPIEVQGTQEVKILGHKGLWINQDEAGISNIKEADYSKSEPRVINKQSSEKVEVNVVQGVKFLRPPPGPAPGKIIITQEPDMPAGPAPPLIIRQGTSQPCAPKPCVLREKPPTPRTVGCKKITIAGRCVAPPRKVIVEKLAPLPQRPGDVIVERWLGINDQPRCVIFKPAKPVCQPPAPENIIIQWSAPCLKVNKKTECLGVNDQDPCQYKQKYGSSLKNASELPDFVRKVRAPGTLAADSKTGGTFKLVGDLEAFKFINLDEVGMGEYRCQLKKAGIKDLGSR